MELTNNKNFTKVFNCFTEPSSEELQYKLTPQELYLFATLGIRKTRVRDVLSVVTSIDLLSQQVTIYKKQSDNKQMIRGLLSRLQTRGIIRYSNPNTNSELLEIFFPEDVLVNRGFEAVYGTLFDLADDAEQFTILTVIQRWQSADGGCTTGIPRWMEILECGRSKVIELLEGMKASGKIVVMSGKNRQTYNRYWIGDGVPVVPSSDLDVITNPTNELDLVLDVVEIETDDVLIDMTDHHAQHDRNVTDDIEDDDEFVIRVESVEKQQPDPFVIPGREESEGIQLARYLAEVQPMAANKVLYGQQFTNRFKPLPRTVLTDIRMYAEHFKVNPSEDVYVQVDRLRRGVEMGVKDLNLEAIDFDEVS